MQLICFYGKSKPKIPETLNRLLNLAENSDLQSHTNKNDKLIMTVLPPNSATSYVTDEDLGDKDGLRKIDHLPASMLLTPAKLENSVNDESDDETEDDGFEKTKKICFIQKKMAKVKHEKWFATMDTR